MLNYISYHFHSFPQFYSTAKSAQSGTLFSYTVQAHLVNSEPYHRKSHLGFYIHRLAAVKFK